MRVLGRLGTSLGFLLAATVTTLVATSLRMDSQAGAVLKPGQAAGAITVNRQALPIAHAAAVSVPYGFDGTRTTLMIVLTPTPLSPAVVAAKTLAAFVGGIKEGLMVELGPDQFGPGSQYRRYHAPVVASFTTR